MCVKILKEKHIQKVKWKQREHWTNVVTFARLFPVWVSLFWSFPFIRIKRRHWLESMLRLFDVQEYHLNAQNIEYRLIWAKLNSNVNQLESFRLGLFCILMNFVHFLRIFSMLSPHIRFKIMCACALATISIMGWWSILICVGFYIHKNMWKSRRDSI